MGYTDEEAKAAWRTASSEFRPANRRAERRAKLVSYLLIVILIIAEVAAVLKG